MVEKTRLNKREGIIVEEALKTAGVLEEACNVQKIDAGMTNHMYLFRRKGEDLLIRIPGEGTEYLVNRHQEVEVYELLKGRRVTEEVLYINGDNGIKITRFLENAHVCDINKGSEVSGCIQHLKKFHELDLKVNHEFDIYKKIEEYEARCKIKVKEIKDYEKIKKDIMDLEQITSQGKDSYCLCHIDPITENFLIDDDNIYLIDWEYAAMCDPLIDIAMFCIYSELSKEKTDQVIDIYFDGSPSKEERKRVYAYMAASAFLWVLWCEIKSIAGENFDQYKEGQLEIAQSFSEYAKK